MANYCDRALFVSPCYYTLILDEEEYLAEMKRLDVKYPPPFMVGGANATTQFFEYQNKLTALVCMPRDTIEIEKTNPIGVVALIVHEAVHIWQQICEHIGEKTPSSEFEAYSIQAITEELLLAYGKAKEALTEVPKPGDSSASEGENLK